MIKQGSGAFLPQRLKQVERIRLVRSDTVTTKKARLKISIEASRTENVFEGYRYALRYGCRNLGELQQNFDEIFFY